MRYLRPRMNKALYSAACGFQEGRNGQFYLDLPLPMVSLGERILGRSPVCPSC